MFSITAEPDRKLIRLHLSGFLTREEVAALVREEQAAAAAMGVRSGEFVLLVESDCMIHLQDVVAAFREALIHAQLKAARIAIVRRGNLTRLQTQRIARVRQDIEIFGTAAEAEAYLFRTDPAKAAAVPGTYQLRSIRALRA